MFKGLDNIGEVYTICLRKDVPYSLFILRNFVLPIQEKSSQRTSNNESTGCHLKSQSTNNAESWNGGGTKNVGGNLHIC